MSAPEQFARLWTEGVPAKDIAAQLGCDPSTVFRLRQQWELPRRRRGRKPQAQRDAEIFALRLAGKSLKEIGEHFGVTGERVRQIIARRGDWRVNAVPRTPRQILPRETRICATCGAEFACRVTEPRKLCGRQCNRLRFGKAPISPALIKAAVVLRMKGASYQKIADELGHSPMAWCRHLRRLPRELARA